MKDDETVPFLGPLNPNDKLMTGSFMLTEGMYSIGSNVYRATRGADGDYEGTMRERCTNCGGSRKGIGTPLYSHPWCTACLRSFNEDGTFKEPPTCVRDSEPTILHQPAVMMAASDVGMKEESLPSNLRKLSSIPVTQLIWPFALILAILAAVFLLPST